MESNARENEDGSSRDETRNGRYNLVVTACAACSETPHLPLAHVDGGASRLDQRVWYMASQTASFVPVPLLVDTTASPSRESSGRLGP